LKERRESRGKKGITLEFLPTLKFLIPVPLLLFLIFGPEFIYVPPPRSSTDQALLEEIPVESRGLGIIEVVFFLITFKNRSTANHQLCDLLQVTGPLNSLKKVRVSSFPTMWYFEPLSGFESLRALGRKGRQK
jgi:hypothetical protein